MYKKILAFVLSSLMLAQSVSAANLYDFVNDSTKIPASILTDNKFDFGKFRIAFGSQTTKEIQTTAEVLASTMGSGVFQDNIVSNSRFFDFKVSLDMSNVRDAMNSLYDTTLDYIDRFAEDSEKDDLKAQFKASEVTGTFVVTVNADNGLTGFETTNVVLQQDGRNPDAFTLVNQTWDALTRTATIEFEVTPGITIEQLRNDITLLNDLFVISTIKSLTQNQTLAVTAQLTSARTVFADNGQEYGLIDYISNDDTATVRFTSQALGKDGLGDDFEEEEDPEDPENPDDPTPPVTEPPKAYLVLTDGNVDVAVDEKEEEYFVDVDAVDVPEKDGFILEGLYLDPVFTQPASGVLQIYADTYLYPKYINVKAPDGFISDEHILYIVGYPDGEVKPNNNITREEVVAALYRLLKPEFKSTLDTDNCQFPDVNEGRWSYESIAAFANAGYVVGDPDGNFNPGDAITRAEFVTIINKFAPDAPQHSGSHFTDISGHWAEKFIISSAIDWSWVTGYEDNTFRPNSRITRAEAVTIINKMLVRYGDVESDFATQWPDLAKSDWYYGAMIEATTEHDYTRNADGWSETWVK